MSAIIYWQNPCKLPMSFRCIKAYILACSGRFSRKCLEGISFNFFVFFIFDWSIGSVLKKKTYVSLYQNWNRTPVYSKLAVNTSNTFREVLMSLVWIIIRRRPDWEENRLRAHKRGEDFLCILKSFLCIQTYSLSFQQIIQIHFWSLLWYQRPFSYELL